MKIELRIPWIFNLKIPVIPSIINIMSDIYPQAHWVTTNYMLLLERLLQNYELQKLQDMIHQPKNYAYIEGYYASLQNNQHLVLYRRNSHSLQCSSSIQLSFKHVYLATTSNEWSFSDVDSLQHIEQLRLYLVTTNDFQNHRNEYRENVGKISFLPPRLIQINIRNQDLSRRFRECVPRFFENGLFYELTTWPELQQWFGHLFPEIKVHQYLFYIYPIDKLQIPKPSQKGSNLLVAIQKQLDWTNNCHWLNSNHSFNFCYIEGSLELSQYLLNQLRKKVLIVCYDKDEFYLTDVVETVSQFYGDAIVLDLRFFDVFHEEIPKIDAVILCGSSYRILQDGLKIHTLLEKIESYPIMGICYGHQALALYYGGKVKEMQVRLIGEQTIHVSHSVLFSSNKPITVYSECMDIVSSCPPDFTISCISNGYIFGIENQILRKYGVQFHPERLKNTKYMIKNFLISIH
jgi:GMP synthase-like glutamine amidotransferase